MAAIEVWMPWYLTDYLRDTIHLSLEEDATYRRALDYLWAHPEGLPIDTGRLARCLRLTAGEFDRCWDSVKCFFQIVDGAHRSSRLDEEYAKALNRSAQARDNRRHDGRPTAVRPPSKRSSDSSPSPSPSPTPSPSPSQEKRFAPPSLAAVQAYCLERKNSIDAEAFVAFYESKGWKVGSQPMKNWCAAIVTWEKRNGKQGQNGKGKFGHQKLDHDSLVATMNKAMGKS